MLECYVSGQSLKLYTPVIAADSLHYLTGRVHFSGADWDGHSAWLHFRQGETVYDVALDTEGAFGEEAELSLTLGEWTLYLTGSDRFPRIRIGMGGCPPEWDLKDWVLSGYHTAEERQTAYDAFCLAADAALCFAKDGIDLAMNRFNK